MRRAAELELALSPRPAGQTLQHSFGSTDQYKTVLTKAEFCKLLTSLREQQKARL